MNWLTWIAIDQWMVFTLNGEKIEFNFCGRSWEMDTVEWVDEFWKQLVVLNG